MSIFAGTFTSGLIGDSRGDDQVIQNDLKPFTGEHASGVYINNQAPHTNIFQSVAKPAQETTNWDDDPKQATKEVLKLHKKSSEAANVETDYSCSKQIIVTSVVDGFLPGCEVLQKQITKATSSKLQTCVMNIRKAIKVDDQGRTSLFRNLYRKLNPLEQDFAAHIFTSIGEARGENSTENVMVMKVLENRVRYAKSKGAKNANVLDVALQSKQFSMYNSTDNNWKVALLGSRNGSQYVINAVNHYITYRNTKFPKGSVTHQLYHYHTKAVRPSWSRVAKQVTPSVKGKKATTHRYFKNVAWSFRHNNYSGKQ